MIYPQYINDIALRHLDDLADYPDDEIGKTLIDGPYNIISVVANPGPEPGDWKITYAAAGPPAAKPGNLLYIDEGANRGHKLIDAIWSTLYEEYATYSGEGTELTSSDLIGRISFYSFNFIGLQNKTDSMLRRAEELCNIKFTGRQEYTELYDGDNAADNRLALRRKFVDDVEITYVNGFIRPPSVLYYLNFFRIDNETGIVYNDYGYPKGRGNIQAKYKAGFDEPPDDVKEAVALELNAGTLQRNQETKGNLTSWNVQGYGESYGKGGIYGDAIQNSRIRAGGLFQKYRTNIG